MGAAGMVAIGMHRVLGRLRSAVHVSRLGVAQRVLCAGTPWWERCLWGRGSFKVGPPLGERLA